MEIKVVDAAVSRSLERRLYPRFLMMIIFYGYNFIIFWREKIRLWRAIEREGKGKNNVL